MQIEPPMVNSQPMIALSPNGARLAGKRKMPEPIMLPTTSASAIPKPSWRGGDVGGWTNGSFTGRRVLQLIRPCAIRASHTSCASSFRRRAHRKLRPWAGAGFLDQEDHAAEHDQAEREQEGLQSRSVEGEQDEGEADHASDRRQR